MVERLDYRKGVYYADVGDFSSTGSARFSIADTASQGLAEATLGEYGYRRGVLIDSTAPGTGDLLLCAELQTFDGPWTDIAEDVTKVNALVHWSAVLGGGFVHLMWMGYNNCWNAANQIRQRAVVDDAITSFKASLVWQPHVAVELYASYGKCFLHNDARGTTLRIDPLSGDAATPADPLVASQGAVLGARVHFDYGLQTTLAAWALRLDSELLFVGDAGTT